MPNWCEGDLKVRGQYADIKKFLKNELKQYISKFEDGELKSIEIPKKIIENDFSFEIILNNNCYEFYLNDSKRCFLMNDIEVCRYERQEENKDVIVNLGTFRSAWSLDKEILIKNSKTYNLDFKIYAYESGMCFNVDFEVNRGKIIKDTYKKFECDSYTWECTNPRIGG